MKRTVALLRRRSAGRARGEDGFVAVWTALLLIVFMGMAAIAVDVSRWYVESARIQKTVDAASLAGVVYMPGSLSSAKSAADGIVTANGWDLSKVTLDKRQGSKPSQFQVTMSTTVTNAFGGILGLPQSTITRAATADYYAPAPMGSPCNVHGNEPWVSGTVQGSALPSPLPSNCSDYPGFWATIVGPEVYKTQGDQAAVRKCGVSPYQESGCTVRGNGGANGEFDPLGYVITVRVTEDLAGPLNVQLYDPAYAETGGSCNWLPAVASDVLGTNTYVDDAKERYRNNPSPISASKPSYCTGDDDNGELRFGAEVPTVTSFGLLKPAANYNPYDPSSNEPADRLCAAQYPGFSKAGGGDAAWTSSLAGTIPSGTATQQLSQNSEFTRLFHRWVDFCTIPGPVKAGDYYLRVRSNVAQGNPQAVFTQTGDDKTVLGNGGNRYAVRAVPSSTADRSKISVSPYAKMPIYANADGSTAMFNLIRVLPGAAGQAIDFTFYDVGDAAGDGTVSVLPPAESKNVKKAVNCQSRGKVNGNNPNCGYIGVRNSNGWNGQGQRTGIPIPSNYDCDYTDLYGCWWRLQVSFGAGVNVTDQTTWTARVDGDPVRLVQ